MKSIYFFEEGSTQMRELLGGKGCELAEMTRLGLPVPPGFVITTKCCKEYQKTKKLSKGLERKIFSAMKVLEQKLGKKFGDANKPLLVSVRSGAPISMPGMMDTILNLGLNDATVKGLAKLTNPRTAYDAYRRFIQMFGEIVLKIKKEKFDRIFDEQKEKVGKKFDYELNADELKVIVNKFKLLVESESGKKFPECPRTQLSMAISAVFDSWNNPRAITYRQIYKIPNEMGTAVVVQSMVFGNLGPDSGTGVVFTRDPSTGENRLYGEYLMNAQGEDVVAGIRTPKLISEMAKEFPELYRQLERISKTLEGHYRDVQDIEFTIEGGKLWILQTRTGKRTAAAAIKIAVDMVKEGLISKEEAIARISPREIEQLLHKQIDPSTKIRPLARGLPASPGAACGKIVFSADDAAARGKCEKVILVAVETTPDDIHGMIASQGVLTARGGMTAHAAIVSRGLGIPCVVGCEAAHIDVASKILVVNGFVFKEGDILTIDGSTGDVIAGEVPLIEPKLTDEFRQFLTWCDSIAKLSVRANADTPTAAATARQLGAKGIGLCRTERMFNDPARLPIVQAMIMAKTKEERQKYLDKLLPLQKGDFKKILLVMDGLPVTIRLLDPPLHEFLPKDPENEEVRKRKEELAEANPMLGHRGCRVGITYPEIYEMQAKAIFEAATELKMEGKNPIVEVMIPFVGNVMELSVLKKKVSTVADEIIKKSGTKLRYSIGTMIEIPRACVTADEIAEEAEFFSFGTNDLTQTVLGLSRDDAEAKFLQKYFEEGIYSTNPFETLDKGVGELIRIAIDLGRRTRKNLRIGVCGETGGDPKSIEFFHKIGVDYVSCSQYRVPVARLACAQAALFSKH